MFKRNLNMLILKYTDVYTQYLYVWCILLMDILLEYKWKDDEKPSKKAFISIIVVVLLLATLIKHNVGDRISEIAGMKELVYFKEEIWVAASVN